jgi:NAD(P)-dependent dehydrogenase (short-subunit alcohol dehydrogenase family)
MSSRVVLVTGASSGIGEATATRLASAGYTVYGAARRVDRIAQLPGVTPIAMDITDDQQVSAAVQRIIDEQGRLDVLINNAGYAQYGPVEDVSIDAARRQFDVNIFGLARLTQLVIPHMRAQGKGTIVNVSSMGGRIYTPLGAWYHATKHALEGWSDCLRVELKPMGINVVIIEPGAIATEFNDVVNTHHVGVSDPYLDLQGKMDRTMSDPSFNSKLSSPTLIADTILKAIQAPKPKGRYMAGYLAKPMWRLRRFGGDGLYDRAVSRILK